MWRQLISISRTPIQKKVGQADKIVNFFFGTTALPDKQSTLQKTPTWHILAPAVPPHRCEVCLSPGIRRSHQELPGIRGEFWLSQGSGTFADAAEGEL